jgi:outer membrane lipoprotein carrier protein
MITALALAATAGHVSAQSPANKAYALLDRAVATYQDVHSLRAEFTQELTNPLLGTRTESAGTMFQREPDGFLMRFSKPAGDVIVSDGQYFWIYYPSVDAKQVIRSPADVSGRPGVDLQAQFIGNPEQRFQATYDGTATLQGRNTDVLTLVPRTDAGYRSMKVWIDAQDHLVRQFEITDAQGVVRQIELRDIVVNPTLPDSLFQFTPPPGARIIDRG